MAGKTLSEDRIALIRRVYAETGSKLATAKQTGHDRAVVARIVADMKAPEKPEPPTRVEVRNASYWQKVAKRLESELSDLEHVAAELAGLRQAEINPPEWLSPPAGTGKIGRSVLGCFVSDVHDGEVISPDEIQGINAFNPAICRARLKRYFEASVIIGRRWASDTECQGVYLALAGDLIAGDIHEDLIRTNALTSTESCVHVTESLAPGVSMLADEFGRVHVVGVPGNHGRTTAKPLAKMYARLSYDTLVLSMLAERFRGDERVTFQFGDSIDQVSVILGRTIFLTHGDNTGTKGGHGFAGPDLPIVRGAKKIREQQASIGRAPYLILQGHRHTSSNPFGTLANGSVPGYAEYPNGLRCAVEPPQQWLFLLHETWGLRERMPVQLEDPRPPPKPRVRVPAAMSS